MNVSSLSRTAIVPNDIPVLCLDLPSGCILSYLTGQSFSPKGNKEIRYAFKVWKKVRKSNKQISE